MRAGRGLARVRPRLGPVPGTGIISGSGGDFELHAACEGGGTLVSTPYKRLVDRSLRGCSGAASCLLYPSTSSHLSYYFELLLSCLTYQSLGLL